MTVKSKKHWFFYSKSMAERGHPHKTFVIVDGAEKQYTEWSHEATPYVKNVDNVLVAIIEGNPKTRIEGYDFQDEMFMRPYPY